METKRNCYDVLDEVISPDNVMNIGELIALKTVQRLVLIKAPRSLYVGLVRDINYKNMPGYIITDGYDLAQAAICFLCENYGKRVIDLCSDPKTGKAVTVYAACSRIVSHEIYKRWLFNRNTRGIDIKKDCYEQDFFADNPDERIQNFTTKYREKYGENPNYFVTNAYESLAMIEQALKEGATDRESLYQNLLKIREWDGETGYATFDENRMVNRDMTVIVVKDGKWIVAPENNN